MLYIDREQRSILIPKHLNCSGSMKLTLKHNLTGTVYEFDNLTNDDTSLLFWTFTNLDFSKLQTGEYNYYLNNINDTECRWDSVMATSRMLPTSVIEYGLLVVTSKVDEPISYNTEKTIIQYGN